MAFHTNNRLQLILKTVLQDYDIERQAMAENFLLLRYRIADLLATPPHERFFAAIPTVLDGAMTPFFCPTPQKADWHKGQALDLTPGTENGYNFICEILHHSLTYKPSYIYRVG